MRAPALSVHAPPALARWWQAKAPREQRIVAALILLVVAALGWLAIWQPLQRDLGTARTAAATERATLAAAQRMSDEIASLARAAPKPPPADARAALERALTQGGLRSAAAQLEWQEGRARVVFAAVDFNALVATLETLQRESGLRIVEATFTAHVDPGLVRAELVLTR